MLKLIHGTEGVACVHLGASRAVRVVGARSADAIGRIGARGGLVSAWLTGWSASCLDESIAKTFNWTSGADAVL